MYHSVQVEDSIISISPDLFAWQMEWLSSQQSHVVSFGNLVEILVSGEPIPDNTIVLTFDDGMESLYWNAYPTLKKHGFTATVFLVAGHCGRGNDWSTQPDGIPKMKLLDWGQIKEMADNNIEFGAHTVSHPFLDTLPTGQAEWEISESKKIIEQNIGQKVEVFAYPYGRYNQEVRDVVSNMYSGACGTYNGYVDAAADRYAVQRIDVNYYKSPYLFRQLFNSVSPPYLMLRQIARRAIGRLKKRDWY